MNVQSDFELDVFVSTDDMTVSYLPVCFDDFLVLARLRHRRPRTRTKCKIHSPIILRANTDMPAVPLTVPVRRPFKKCLSLPTMTSERLQ